MMESGDMNKEKKICYLICGFLGAGKTTYSKKLVQEKKAIHLNADEWCMKLFSKDEYETNWENCFLKTMEYLWDKASEFSKQGQSVVFDIGFWDKKSRIEAIDKARELGFLPIIHYVYAPDDILKERISLRKGLIAENNLKHFDEIKKLFEEPDDTEDYIRIDNY